MASASRSEQGEGRRADQQCPPEVGRACRAGSAAHRRCKLDASPVRRRSDDHDLGDHSHFCEELKPAPRIRSGDGSVQLNALGEIWLNRSGLEGYAG